MKNLEVIATMKGSQDYNKVDTMESRVEGHGKKKGKPSDTKSLEPILPQSFMGQEMHPIL